MKTIGVFFGSRSPEHDISIITAMRVMEGFAKLGHYRAIPVYISREGEWFSGDKLGEIDFFREPAIEKRLGPYAIDSLSIGNGRFRLYPSKKRVFSLINKPTSIDIAFPCFHGSFGEDGTIQGLFEISGIPYVGCGVLASAIAMSKIHTRRLLRDAGIPTVPTVEVWKDSFPADPAAAIKDIRANFTYPLFVKPNALGSSIAVSRVTNDQELMRVLDVVFQFDRLALVEQAVRNLKEINVLVIGHRELTVSETEEPRFGEAFQTFESKYLTKGGTIRQSGKTGKTSSRIPAAIPPELARDLKGAAQRAFRILGASGISRFDFLVDGRAGEWFLGEVNTLPGTLHAHLWEASGIPLPELIDRLIGFAEERQGEESSLLRTFASGVLTEK